MSAERNYKIAARWDTAKDADRRKVKQWIVGLVGYPCKLACQPNEGCIDIYVWSELKGKITDWLELQPSGAIGVIFDEYPDPDAKAVWGISERCEAYNESAEVVFLSDSDSEDSSDDSSEDSSDAEPSNEDVVTSSEEENDEDNDDEDGESATK